MQNVIFYFSGTGNSELVAREFARVMTNTYAMPFSAVSIEGRKDVGSLIAEAETVGLCYPVYGSSVPRIMREFAGSHKQKLDGKKIVIFATQMLFSGDGARAMTDVLKPMQCEVIYAEHFFMPNNVCNIRILPVKNAAACRPIWEKARRRMRRVCADIAAGRVKKRGFNPISHFLGLFQRPFFMAGEKKLADSITIDQDKCIGCRRCVRRCPTGNLSFAGGQVRTAGSCTLCYRCVNLCPAGAINAMTKGKIRKQYKGIAPDPE